MEAEMNKTIYIAFAAIALLLVNSMPVLAWHGGHFGGGVWLGPGWVGPYYPYYPYNPYYPYYAAPLVVIPQQPDAYVQPASQQEEQQYWYYCRNPEGYYPNVKKCPSGWMKVVPSPPTTDQEE